MDYTSQCPVCQKQFSYYGVVCTPCIQSDDLSQGALATFQVATAYTASLAIELGPKGCKSLCDFVRDYTGTRIFSKLEKISPVLVDHHYVSSIKKLRAMVRS
jgi:hypothetical protein